MANDLKEPLPRNAPPSQKREAEGAVQYTCALRELTHFQSLLPPWEDIPHFEVKKKKKKN